MAPQAPIPLHTTSPKGCVWMPTMGVLELHNAPKYCVGAGVVPQAPIPLHTTSLKGCFWMPTMGVFEPHDSHKYCVGAWVVFQAPIPPHTTNQKGCFWMPTMGVFEHLHTVSCIRLFFGGLLGSNAARPLPLLFST